MGTLVTFLLLTVSPLGSFTHILCPVTLVIKGAFTLAKYPPALQEPADI